MFYRHVSRRLIPRQFLLLDCLKAHLLQDLDRGELDTLTIQSLIFLGGSNGISWANALFVHFLVTLED